MVVVVVGGGGLSGSGSGPGFSQPDEKIVSGGSEEHRDRIAQASSLDHMFTHIPLSPQCRHCIEGKWRRRKRQRKSDAEREKMRKHEFGDLVTAGHLIRRDSSGIVEGPEDVYYQAGVRENGFDIKDGATEVLCVYPRSLDPRTKLNPASCISRDMARASCSTLTTQGN